MEKVAIVTKTPEHPARVSFVDPTLADLQKIVGGHIKQMSLLQEGVHRITLIMHDCRTGAETLNVKVNEREIYGPIAIVKYDTRGELVSLDKRELEAWAHWVDRDTVSEHGPAQDAEVNDSMQIMIVPPHVDIETGAELSPGETIGRLMTHFDRAWEDISPEKFPAIYQAALITLHQQDHQFMVIDDDKYLLGFPDAEGDRKFLRVIRFIDSEPITFETMADFAAYYNASLSELSDTIRDQHIGQFSLKILDNGIELNGLPLELPFTDRDWRELIAESETPTVQPVPQTAESDA